MLLVENVADSDHSGARLVFCVAWRGTGLACVNKASLCVRQQVILSVFLDHATEIFFNRLGLPVHSKEALSACDYYGTVIDDLLQRNTAQWSSTNKDMLQPLTTPPQLARVAAAVDPLCSMSPKTCLMTDALGHELLIALCKETIQRSVKVEEPQDLDLTDVAARVLRLLPDCGGPF